MVKTLDRQNGHSALAEKQKLKNELRMFACTNEKPGWNPG